MHSHTRRPQVKKSNWVPLIIHVSFFGVKYWSHPHYWAWLWFKLKTSEVSFLPVRSSGPSFVLPIVKLCLRVNLTKQSVVYNLSRISRASTKHGKKKRKKKKRTETTQPIQSSKHFTGYLIFFRLDAKVLLAGQAPCEPNLNLNVNFWIWPGRSRRASIYFLLRVAVISLHLNKAAAETKKKKKKLAGASLLTLAVIVLLRELQSTTHNRTSPPPSHSSSLHSWCAADTLRVRLRTHLSTAVLGGRSRNQRHSPCLNPSNGHISSNVAV